MPPYSIALAVLAMASATINGSPTGTHAEVNAGAPADDVLDNGHAQDDHHGSDPADADDGETHQGTDHAFGVANDADTDTHITDEEVGSHVHSDTADGSTGWDTTTSSAMNSGSNTGANATQAPTKAPTLAPVVTTGTCTYDGSSTKPVGWVGPGAGEDYCFTFTCNVGGTMTDNKAGKPACGTPNNSGDVCQNIECHFTNNMVQVTHKDGDNFNAIEGSEHHCKYNQATTACTCHCHGANGILWHSYEDWYCATDNGVSTKPTHITYTSGTYNPADNSLLPQCASS